MTSGPVACPSRTRPRRMSQWRSPGSRIPTAGWPSQAEIAASASELESGRSNTRGFVAILRKAHSVSHADLTRLSAASLRHEVADAKAMLEGLLRHPVLDFCYPSGKLNAAVAQEVQAAGFLSATTTTPGAAR